MNMIFLLIGFSILLALLFLLAFFWASKSGQNDDLYTPAVRILFDDHPNQQSAANLQQTTAPLQQKQTNAPLQQQQTNAPQQQQTDTKQPADGAQYPHSDAP